MLPLVVMTPRERVQAEMGRFRAALPRLLTEMRGKWVVFRDGQVQGVFDSEEAAYIDGLKRYGSDGGHVVAQIVEEVPTPLNAGVVFDLGR